MRGGWWWELGDCWERGNNADGNGRLGGNGAGSKPSITWEWYVGELHTALSNVVYRALCQGLNVLIDMLMGGSLWNVEPEQVEKERNRFLGQVKAYKKKKENLAKKLLKKWVQREEITGLYLNWGGPEIIFRRRRACWWRTTKRLFLTDCRRVGRNVEVWTGVWIVFRTRI